MDKRRSTALILSLASTVKIGPVRIKAILSQVADPSELIDWDISKFCGIPGISRELSQKIKENLSVDYGNKLIDWAEDHGYGVLSLIDDGFPAGLRHLYDPPPYLFVRGSLNDMDDSAVAMVGSRSATEYGKRTAESLAGEMARNGITIVSGMAIGIDSAAHRGALAAGGRTIAVLGSGIDIIYPKENKKLYRQISENGAVISEFLPGVMPDPGHFPRRNRLISGLSQAVIVIEAGYKSGALLTADLALSQGKKLFAVPGNLTSKLSLGTNDLIKSGAGLLTSIDDIFSVLPHLKKDYIAPEKKITDGLSDGESLVFRHLSAAPKQLDSLVRESGLTVRDATAYLLSLELRGLVRQLSGKRFMTT